MTRTQGNTGRALGVVGAIGLLAGCTAGPPASTPGVATSSSASSAREPACGTAPKALVERVATSVAAHPGTITGTSYVFAATTDTGDWYVLGIDRTYVHDDGSPGLGPEGDHSRSLALTNAARKTDGSVAMIALSVAVSDKLPVSWDRVSWTGETLAAGKRAAARAMECLDTKG
ncbi:hypothetical protein [Intrasporangium sp. YIM S08009]|uniref:hypothetical protein n=1 Tax=Intrasporangium zincisolvens TaxID=3080018 RepID=UPI002B0572CA|nr:hypothetical protein [Intrasporangium sp. YIM S08009]